MDASSLYTREHARIHTLCFAILHDRDDAEDAVQETFARVSARLDGLRGDPTGYLVTVARNVCRDELQRRARRAATTGAAEIAVVPGDVEDSAVARGLLRFVWQHLSHRERAVLAGVAGGFSHAEIAAREGISVDLASQRISRVRRRIRRLITAPAALLAPLVDGLAAGRLRRLGHLPADILAALPGRAPQYEPIAGALLIAIIAGALGLPAAPRVAPPPTVAAVHGIAGIAPPALSAAAHPTGTSILRRLPHATATAPAAPAAPPFAVPPPGNGLEAVRFTGFTAAPDYDHDHIVFATADTGACTASCSALYRSDDGARTWRALGGAGLAGGAIALPPGFPADPRIFAVAPLTGILRSDDGGASFHAVLPLLNGVAALDPTSPPGDARFFVAVQDRPPLLLYDDRQGAVQAVVSLPADTESITQIFTGPGAGDVYANVATAAEGIGLYACAAAAGCHRVGPALGNVPLMSPTFGSDQTLFIREADSLTVRSVDGATTLHLPLGATPMVVLPDADFATTRRVEVAAEVPGLPLVAQLFQLARGLDTVLRQVWTPRMDLSTATRLPDGHVLVALQPDLTGAGSRGLACSDDDALTWQPRC